MSGIEEAAEELVPISTPESRRSAKYRAFWQPIEAVADDEPELEDVPPRISMALEEPKKRKRGRRR